jgi:hypothetical protein
MREGIANATAIQVNDVILLTAGEDHAPAKSIGALGSNQARFDQTFQGIAEGLQVRAQVAAAGIANSEFLDEPGIMHTALGQVIHAFAMTMQLELVEAGGTSEELRSGSKFLRQVGDTLSEREMVGEFDKADKVATAPTAVTVEQVFLRVNVERGMSVLMKRAESRELGAGTDPMPSPVVPLQVLEQRNTLFEPFEILAHGVHSSSSVKV